MTEPEDVTDPVGEWKAALYLEGDGDSYDEVIWS